MVWPQQAKKTKASLLQQVWNEAFAHRQILPILRTVNFASEVKINMNPCSVKRNAATTLSLTKPAKAKH
jgi:hypothetical protein